jgi:hypothetical protein
MLSNLGIKDERACAKKFLLARATGKRRATRIVLTKRKFWSFKKLMDPCGEGEQERMVMLVMLVRINTKTFRFRKVLVCDTWEVMARDI